MATSKEEMTQQKLTFRRFKDGDNKHRPWQEEIFKAGWSHKCPTYVLRTPPCQGSCPSGHDIRGWMDILRGIEKPTGGMSWQEYAFQRMVDANPFPAVMGRVCPAPCEDGCNRNQVEDHVGINSIEHFIGDYAIQHGLKLPAAGPDTGKKVAIIGGGPAGLSCAYQLRRMGHAVTIFDDHAELGGFMRYGIPGYRTPRDILDAEIKRILDLGVETRMNTRVGRDISIDDLNKEFDAVFWAIGTHSGRGLPVPGADAPNCITGIDFLRAFNEGRLQYVTGKVVVVGGGDTSIDVASVARRLGHITNITEKDRPENVVFGHTAHDVASTAVREGADVTLTSLFPIEQMTAAEREREDALHEGVKILGSVMPIEVIKDASGRATGLRMAECDMVNGAPVARPGTEFVLEADLIVSAIGQKGNLEGLEQLDNGKGFINADRHFQVPNMPGHFVGGDIIRPHLLTTAIGHGWVAANSIDQYLKRQTMAKLPKVNVHHFDLLNKLREMGLEPEEAPHDGVRGTSEAKFAVHNFEDRSAHEIIPADQLFLGHFSFTPRNRREELKIDAESVIGNFQERLKSLSEKEAVAEAKRCMSCGMCFECDNCVIYCPQQAVKKTPKSQYAPGRYVYTEYARCIGCHICSEVCPTGYIQMGLGE